MSSSGICRQTPPSSAQLGASVEVLSVTLNNSTPEVGGARTRHRTTTRAATTAGSLPIDAAVGRAASRPRRGERLAPHPKHLATAQLALAARGHDPRQRRAAHALVVGDRRLDGTHRRVRGAIAGDPVSANPERRRASGPRPAAVTPARGRSRRPSTGPPSA